MTRAAYGTGSLVRNNSGTWSYYKTVAGRRRKVTRPTKTAARAAMSEIEAAVARGDDEPTRQRQRRQRVEASTVADVLDQFLAVDLPSRNRAPSTVHRHKWAAAHIRQHIGRHPARTLRIVDVERMLADAATNGLSRASCDKLRNTLSQALQAAWRREIVERDVAKLAVLPADAARARPRSALRPVEARQLLAELPNHRYGLAFAMSLRVGLRPGEAFALHWGDVVDGRVNVARGLRRDGGAVQIVGNLKTEESRRSIELPDDLKPWIDRHRESQTVERERAERWADPRLMFATPNGAPVQPDRARYALTVACQAAGVPVMRPNELRHSCASLLSDAGVPNERIADLLGHTTTRMVDETYRHRLRASIDVAAVTEWATE